jgi:hypothetical protein
MKFYTGKDYPHLCNGCKTMVDQCVEAVEIGPDTDDNEAPIMLAGDMGLLCGGGDCDCDCSIGFPDLDKSLDVFCPAHGGTDEEQQVASEELCKQDGHLFPLKREGYCRLCRKAYGQAEPITIGNGVTA